MIENDYMHRMGYKNTGRKTMIIIIPTTNTSY